MRKPRGSALAVVRDDGPLATPAEPPIVDLNVSRSIEISGHCPPSEQQGGWTVTWEHGFEYAPTIAEPTTTIRSNPPFTLSIAGHWGNGGDFAFDVSHPNALRGLAALLEQLADRVEAKPA
jgi:hypothetical protein